MTTLKNYVPGLEGFIEGENQAQRRGVLGLNTLRGVLGARAILANQAEKERLRGILGRELPQAVASGDRSQILGVLGQVAPAATLPYLLAKPGTPYTLTPGQTRFGADDKPVASLPKMDVINLGNRFEAVDKSQLTPGESFEVGVSPTAEFSQEQQNRRHATPSASTVYAQDQANRRHASPGALRRGPGVHELPDGSTVSNAQLMSMWKTENNLVDPIDLQILGKTDPGRAAMKRDKIAKATPFQQWAKQRFGIDVTGGFTPMPATPPPGSPQPTPRPMGNVEQRKQLGAKSYVKIGGQWFEE